MIAGFAVGELRFVAGLQWNAIHSLPQQSRERVKQARDGGFHSAVTWRRDGSPTGQFGFARSREGADPGDYSLASALADKLGDGWAAVIPIGMGDGPNYAMVAVTGSGAISVDAVGSRDSILEVWRDEQERFAGFQESGRRVFAPAELLLASEELDVTHILGEGVGVRHRLEQAFRRGTRLTATGEGSGKAFGQKIAFGALVLLIVGLFAWFHYDDQQAAREAEQAAQDERDRGERDKRTREAEGIAAAAARAQTAESPPWPNQPRATAFLEACGKALTSLPLSIEGWALKEATCDSLVKATYTRRGNRTVEQFIASARWQLSTRPVMSQDKNQGTVQITVRDEAAASNEPLVDGESGEAALYSHFQGISVPVDVVKVEEQVDPSRKKPPRPWLVYTIKISKTSMTPYTTRDHVNQLLSGFDLPGLRIASLSMVRLDASPWLIYDVSGTFYAHK